MTDVLFKSTREQDILSFVKAHPHGATVATATKVFLI